VINAGAMAMPQGRLGWVGALVALALCGTVHCANRPELSDFEMLYVVTGDTGAPQAARAPQVTDAQWNSVDAKLMDAAPGHPQMLSGFEPYTDGLDSLVTASGMPDSLLDGDSVLHNNYEDWIRGYKRIPNEPEVPWSYDGPDSSPDLWSTLNKNYQLCDPDLTGKMSSPINIPTDRALPSCFGDSFPIKNGPEWVGGAEGLTELFDRSFTVDVQHCEQECKICDAKCKAAPEIAATSEHKAMVLDRIVFHTPSEHKIDNEAAALELQFYHCMKDEAQDHMPCTPTLAFAILFKDGGASASNPAWMNKLFGTVSKVGNKPQELAKGMKFEEISTAINPLFKQYYNYVGSQTSPPCYQGVQWMVGKEMLELSTSVIEGFKMRQGENVRPEFQLGYRQLQLMSKESDKHWTYDGPRGETWWPTQKEYTSCGNGAPDCEKLSSQTLRDKCIADTKVQSPVDIYTRECMPNKDYGGLPCVKPIGLRPIKFDVGTSSKEDFLIYIKDGECQPLTNEFNAYTLTVKVPGNVRMTYLNTIYTLREIEFHTPSEHSFDGVRGVMEIQFKMEKTGCVTRSNGHCVTPNNNINTKLHLAILFEQGKTSPQFVENLATAASAATGTPEALIPDMKFIDISVNIHALLSTYFFYDGSLTTPPCTSAVTWLVVKTVLSVKGEHLEMIKKVLPGGTENSRDMQPLNSRGLSVAGTIQL